MTERTLNRFSEKGNTSSYYAHFQKLFAVRYKGFTVLPLIYADSLICLNVDLFRCYQLCLIMKAGVFINLLDRLFRIASSLNQVSGVVACK